MRWMPSRRWGYVEVDEQTYVAAAEPNVRQQLGLMNRIDGFHALDLDDNSVFDD